MTINLGDTVPDFNLTALDGSQTEINSSGETSDFIHVGFLVSLQRTATCMAAILRK